MNHRPRALRITVLMLMLGLVFTIRTAQSSQAASPDIVISQVYGGGGNSGASFTHDFIELFNRGTSPVNIGGWSVQYASAGGSTWQVTTLSGLVQPGQHYLVQESSSGSIGSILPTPDATGTIVLDATEGKVALVINTTPLSCGRSNDCVPAAHIRDFIGYGVSANSFEGAGPTANLGNTTAARRYPNDCTDTDDNSADFVTGIPNPRNSASPLSPCDGPPPTDTSTATPANTPTSTPTDTDTSTPTGNSTPAGTSTPAATDTPTSAHTPFDTPTDTVTATDTSTPADTPTPISTDTPATTSTATDTPTPAPTPQPAPVINEIHADPHATLGDANGDGLPSNTQDEFVEIVNNTGATVDLSGWTLNDVTGLRHTFPANTLLGNGCAIVVFGGGAPLGAFGGSLVQTASSGSLGLTNTGDTLTLFDLSAAIAAAHRYNLEGNDDQSITRDPDITGPEPLVKHTLAVGSNGALFSPGVRLDGSAFTACTPPTPTPAPTPTFTPTPTDTATATSTPTDTTTPTHTLTPAGTLIETLTPTPTHTPTDTLTPSHTPTSTFTPTDTPTPTPTPTPQPALVINEILADPAGDANGDGAISATQDEFIEIVNNTGRTADLSGWALHDGVGLRHTFSSNTLLGNGCAIVVFAGGTPAGAFGGSQVQTASTGQLGLNNTGDAVTLFDFANAVAAAYTYGVEGGNDQSITRDPDIIGPEPLVNHTTATGSNTAPFSPGTRADGGTFSACTPPTPTPTSIPTDTPTPTPSSTNTFTPSSTSTPQPAIVINEILADPAGDANGDGTVSTSQDEFVEIANNTGSTRDISGWTLHDGVGLRHTFPENTILSDGCAVLVFGGGTPNGSFGRSRVQTASSGTLGLNNAGDTLTLFDAGSAAAATVTYGGEASGGQSITRDPDIVGPEPLVQHSTAPAANGALFSPGTRVNGTLFVACPLPPTTTPTTAPTDTSTPTPTRMPQPALIINEIHADPDAALGDANGDGIVHSGDDEFIEIVNHTGVTRDISGWALHDAVGPRHTFPANTILSDGCTVLVFGGGTPNGSFGGSRVQTASSGILGLNNSGDTITLFDPGAAIAATYTYGSEGGGGQSLARDPDVTGPEPLIGHSVAGGSNGALFSPGVKLNGDPFVACPPPPPSPTPTPPPTPERNLIINEILADPHASQGDANNDGAANTTQDEFVEIVNNTGSNANIGGWTLSDSIGRRHTFPPNTILSDGCAIVVFGGGSSRGNFGGSLVMTASEGALGLNNTGDAVILRNTNGQIVTSYAYGSEAGDDQSITRDPDVAGSLLVKHTTAAGANGARFSPGRRVGTASFVACPEIRPTATPRPTRTPVAERNLIINEIHADPDDRRGDANGDGTASTTQDEFVEIVNNSGELKDIGGWTLHDAVGLRHTFPPGTVLSDGCAILVFAGGSPAGDFRGSLVQTASSGSLGLNNTGDDVVLFDPAGRRVTIYTYGSEGGDNQSITRDPDVIGSVLVRHSMATNSRGRLFSSGVRVNRTSFAPCPTHPPTPTPGPTAEPPAQLIINEIHADPHASEGDANGDGTVSTTQDEFVEIVNNTGTAASIGGWTLHDGVGLKHAFPNDTVILDDCSIVVFGGGAPAGAFGDGLVQTASSGSLGLNNTGDTVSVFDASGALVVSHTYGGEGGDDQSLTRDPDVAGSDPLVKHTQATGSNGARFSPGTRIDGTRFAGCGASTSVRIRDIQGVAHRSPLAGQQIHGVPGIVTALRNDGFYMQDPNPDANEAASEGIFVSTVVTPGVAIGDSVIITGAAVEFYPAGFGSGDLSITQIASPTVTLVSSGNALPPATTIGIGGRLPPSAVIDDDAMGDVETGGSFDAAADGIDFYESLEGMRVQIEQAVAAGPTTPSGEIAIVANGGISATLRTPRGGLVVQPGDFNPERIILDGALMPLPILNVGDTFSGTLAGVLSYGGGNFKLLVTEPASVTLAGLIVETATLPGPELLSIASFNVENLDPGDDSARFAGLAGQIVFNLHSPDIIALQEIQDNSGLLDDGTVDAGLTYSTLISAVLAYGGPAYSYRDIAPLDGQDSDTPGDNARAGFLFRPDRVAFVDRPGGDATTPVSVTLGIDGVELSISPGRIDPMSAAFTGTHKSLAGEFVFQGRKVFVIANHFNSKSGDDPLFGRIQPPVAHSEAQRLQIAQAVNDFVDSLLALDPDAGVVVLGSVNDFPFSASAQILAGGVLTDLMHTLPPEEQYDFVLDGNAQALSNILVSRGQISHTLVQFDVVHVNAEFAPAYRYSDHDPLLARFWSDATPPTTTAQLSGTIGANGWYVSDVQMTLAGIDDATGVALTEYSLDGGASWLTYAEPLTLTREGLTPLGLRSIDHAANVEVTRWVEVKIDKTAPEAVLSFDRRQRQIVLGGHDRGSGVAGVSSPGLLPGTQSYLITDTAGHTLTLSIHDRQDRAFETASIWSLSYDGGPAYTPPRNRLTVTWRGGAILTRVEQSLRASGSFRAGASWNRRDHRTFIVSRRRPDPEVRYELQGWVPLQLFTAAGTLDFAP